MENKYIIFKKQNGEYNTYGRVGEYFPEYRLKVGDIVSWVYDEDLFNRGFGIILKDSNGEPKVYGLFATDINELFSVNKVMDCSLLTTEKLKTIDSTLDITELEEVTLEEAERLIGKKIVI
jgi:hypothetical protein